MTAPRDSTSTRVRSTQQLADGVFAIRHEDAPDGFPQGNTTVIAGTREALVIDSCYLPSSAERDVADIRQWTSLKVGYLVNTHWHYDHTMGNGVYRDSFPGVSVVAHRETRKQIAGYNPQWFANFPKRGDQFREAIASGKDASGRTLTAGEIAEYEGALAGLDPVGREFEPLARRTDLAPDTEFERELVVDLGDREVHLLHLGRGNTAGDVVAWLPAERLLVAGDLLDHPVPYLGGGYPIEEIATLRALADLGAEAIVPGHGMVLHGEAGGAYLAQVIEFLEAVVAAVDVEQHRAGGGPRKLEIVKAAVLASFPVTDWRQRFAGDDVEDGDFFEGFSLDGVITATYAALWPR
jgi:glyoxylase-like metal-dependent hydrolase (beta-lactamase superfamily II)